MVQSVLRHFNSIIIVSLSSHTAQWEGQEGLPSYHRTTGAEQEDPGLGVVWPGDSHPSSVPLELYDIGQLDNL